MRPGANVTSRAASPARGEPTDTGPWFVTGITEQGPSGTAQQVTSLADYVAKYGNRVSAGQLYDALELYFGEGGADAYVSRVIGPAPIKASHTFADGAAADALKVEALYYGDYANGATGGLTAEVAAGSSGAVRTLIIRLNAVEVERFTDLDAGDMAAATLTSDYVRATDLAGGLPAIAAAQNLTGGTDDHGNAIEANWTTALAVFTRDLGPGQVSAPGRTTAAAQTALLAHGVAQNRTAYLDAVDQANKATLLAAALALEDLAASPYGGFFGTWYEIGPLVAGGARRAVPGSAYAAGVTARTDALEGTAGVAPAGEAGKAFYALAVRGPAGGFTDDDYTDLNEAGVNMARDFRNRGIQLYGFVSVTSDEEWHQLSYNRERVSLTARLNDIALDYVFDTIDGQGHLFARLNGELAGECLSDFKAGVLYGSEPGEAFRVDTSSAVNTPATIANGEIHAQVSARFSPFAEMVNIDIIKVPVTGIV